MSRVRVYLRVSGAVQGVGFRYFTQREARRLGLAGYVRNLPNGDVELEAEGVEDHVKLLEQAVKCGPGGVRVNSPMSEARSVTGGDADFEIRF